MRPFLALLALVCTLEAHPNWKPTTAEAAVVDGQLRITLRIDVPPYLLGLTPQAAEVSALDDFMFDDKSALGRKLAEAPQRLRGEIGVEVSGLALATGTPTFPTAEQVRAQMRSQPEEDRYPIMLPVIVQCPMPSSEGQLRLRFPAILGNVLITFRTSPDRIDMVTVPPGEWSDPVPISGPTRGFVTTLTGFLRAGFGHVLPDGWDHALFMLAMFLSAPTLRLAFLRSLSFTLGHSLTLGLVWYGCLASPGEWIEPMIALSIVAAGVLAALGRSSSRWALAGSCGFGLLHGLGFAAAADFTQSGSSEVLGALAGFNIGIELAQLLVIATACLVVLPFVNQPWFETRLRRPLAWLTALGGLWLLWVCL
jgi:hydrogenase/urease accessory protein HupE